MLDIVLAETWHKSMEGRNERLCYEINVNTWNIQYGYILVHFLSHISLFRVMRCFVFPLMTAIQWWCSCNLTETLGHFWWQYQDTSLKLLHQYASGIIKIFIMCDLGNLFLEFYHQEFNRRKIYAQIGHYNIIQNSETLLITLIAIKRER